MTTHTAYYHSPIGWLEVTGTTEAIHSVRFVEDEELTTIPEAPLPNGRNIGTSTIPAVIQTCLTQLDDYFHGRRQSFDLPLHLAGTPFQQQVWNSVQSIPCGETKSYRHIATAIGRERAVRAVGTANGQNLLALLIPCHRVIGTDSSLRGYAWGLWRKEWLIQHEKASPGDLSQ